MNQPAPDQTPAARRPARLGCWLTVMLALVGITAVVVLGYPGWRQRQVIAELQKRGIAFQVEPLLGDDWPEWLRKHLKDALIRRVEIEIKDRWPDPDTDDDLRLISQLLAYTYSDGTKAGRSKVSLSSSTVSDRGLGFLKGEYKIQNLYLDGAPLTDRSLNAIGRMTQLNALSLDGIPITDAGVEKLSRLDDLEWLFLNDTAITDAGLVHLQKLPRLKYLCVKGTRITNAGLIPLTKISSLESVSVSRTHVTEAGIAEIRKGMPNPQRPVFSLVDAGLPAP